MHICNECYGVIVTLENGEQTCSKCGLITTGIEAIEITFSADEKYYRVWVDKQTGKYHQDDFYTDEITKDEFVKYWTKVNAEDLL